MITDRHDSTEDIEAHNPFLGNNLGIDGLPAAASASIGERTIEVSFADGVTHNFHHQWLRFSCYCQICGNCLVNTSEGGMSTYVDGFAIADAIATEEPDAWQLLTTVPISHIRRHPGEIDMRNRGPLISLDEFGRASGIRYFDRALAPLDCAPDLIEPMLDAIRAFNRRMADPAFIAEIRVAPGNGMLIDNHRVMHGRTAFDPTSGRHIRLCHVPRDEFHGRLRELSRTLDPAGHDQHLPQGSTLA